MPAEREERGLTDTSHVARDHQQLHAELAEAESQRQRLETRVKMLETAVETITLGVTVSDMDGKIIYVNSADAQMHGYARDELVGEKVTRYVAIGGAANDATEADVPWVRERLDTTKDGRTFPVRLISDRLRDSSQEPIATVTICEDLREQQLIKEALARHDLILEALGLAAKRFLADASWEENVQEVLERLGRATGVDLIYIALLEQLGPFAPNRFFLSWETPADSDGKTLGESLGLPARVDLFARWEDRLRGGETLHGRVDDLQREESQVLEACGVRTYAVVPIFVDSTLRGYLCLEDGDPDREWWPAELQALHTAASTFSASLQKREAEKALSSSERKFRDLLDNANDLIQSVSPDGHFQYVNRAWREALGYDADEVQKLHLWDVVQPAPDSERDVLQTILSGSGDSRVEAVFVTKDGREIIVEGNVNCRYVDGLPVSTRGIFRDISERKLAERMLHEFISTVSHELRTPLTSIIASLGLLDSGQLDSRPDRSRELVAVAHRNSQRLLQLINNLLDLQRISAGRMTFKIEPYDAGDLLAEAVEDIRAFADSEKIRLRLAEVDEGLELFADRDRLLQVLNNLLSNAIKFSPDDTEVTIAAHRHDESIRITVADQGPGIPEEFRAKLFERFTQFDSGGTRRSGGSGLGLSIVKGLVEAMQGSVELAPPGEQGTTFYVDLPADLEEEEEEEEEEDGAESSSR